MVFLSHATHNSKRKSRHGLSRGSMLFYAVIISLLYINIIRISVPMFSDATVQADTPNATSTQPAPVKTTLTYSALMAADVATTGSVACTGTSYVAPGGVDLTSMTPGVHIITDDPTYYTVSGNTTAELRDAIESCAYRQAAAGTYHAITSYQLNWQYSIASNGTSCSIKNAKVGMHINQLMPGLNGSSALSAEDVSHWLDYSTSLITHEDGHAAIDQQYAKELYAALQNINGNCGTIDQTAKMTINSYLEKLKSANASYDTQTDHGTEQGALL